MKKTTKSFVLLCSAACLFTLALAGCKKKKSTPVDPTGQPTASTSVPVQVTHTVTFNTQGGSAVQAQTVKHGEKAVKPADPRKAEDAQYTYTFKGWYEEKECVVAFDFNTEITADWTIYAGWNKIEKGGEPTEPVGPTTGEPTEPVGPTVEPTSDLPISASIGGRALNLVEGLNDDPNRDAWYYASGIDVEAGEDIVILKNGQPFTSDFGPAPDGDTNYNNYVGSLETGFKVQASAVDTTLHISVWKSGWTNFWLEQGVSPDHGGGEPTPTVPAGEGFGIMINDTDYHAGVADGKDFQDRDQYKVDGVQFEAGDHFAIYDAANQVSWIETGEGIDQWSFGSDGDGANIPNYISVGEGYYEAVQDFTANIYIKIAWENNSIYFGLADGGDPVTPTSDPTPTVPAGEGFGIMINDTDYHAGVADGKDFQDRDQYKVDGVQFEAGDHFAIYDAANQVSWIETGEGIDQWSFGSDGDGANIPNYISVGEGYYEAVQDFTANIYIKIAWENNSIYFGL